MLNKARFFLSLLLISALYTQTALSQYYTLGNDPFRARWRQISSEHYKIIYPEETDSLSAASLHYAEQRSGDMGAETYGPVLISRPV